MSRAAKPLLIVSVAIVGAFHPTNALASSAYETAVLANSPSVYYRLGESSGTTATDDSGNSVTGTYSGSGVTYGVTGTLSGDADRSLFVCWR